MAADLDPDAPGGWLAQLRFDADGLITAIAQEAGSGRILMVATMNRETLAETARRREAVYWSRSRGRRWHKGEESGHIQKVLDIRTDCDGDVVLLTVEQAGGTACHTGRHSCFFNQWVDGRWVPAEPVRVDPAVLYPGRNSPAPVQAPALADPAPAAAAPAAAAPESPANGGRR